MFIACFPGCINMSRSAVGVAERLFRFDNAKDAKKIPTQPGWIELGMIWE